MDDARMNSVHNHMGCKYDQSQRSLKFTTGLADHIHIPPKRPKIPNRDPMSHRIIEKRRRDRMNNCLADLSHLIPASYTKQGQGRIEKTEIIEMAIKYINHLLALVPAGVPHDKPVLKSCCADKKYQGFTELSAQVSRHLTETEGMNDDNGFYARLQNHISKCAEELKKEIFALDNNTTAESSGNYVSAEDPSCASSSTTDSSKTATTGPNDAQKDTQDGDSSSSGYYGSCEVWESQVVHENATGSPTMEQNSRLSSSGGENSQNSDRAKEIYKYKNNIQLRFNAMHGDNSVSQDEGNQEKRSQQRVSPPESTESSYYPLSETSSVSGNSSGIWNCTQPCCKSEKSQHVQESSSEGSIPGFALHHTGTHYVPVALRPSCLSSSFNAMDTNSLGVFHPISIPVNFGGTFGLFEKKKSENMTCHG